MTQEHSNKEQTPKIKAGPRAIALVGPHGGGKTTLLESIAMITGAVQRKGSVATGSSLGDSAPRSPRPPDERGGECADHPIIWARSSPSWTAPARSNFWPTR